MGTACRDVFLHTYCRIQNNEPMGNNIKLF